MTSNYNRLFYIKSTQDAVNSTSGSIATLGGVNVAKNALLFGNVGIGTTSPNSKLHVYNGNISILGAASTLNINTTDTSGNYNLNVSGSSIITSLSSTSGTLGNLSSTNITTSNVIFTNGTISNLSLTGATIATVNATTVSSGNIYISGNSTIGGSLYVGGTVQATNITSTNIIDVNASIGTLVSSLVSSGSLTVTNLSSSSVVSVNVTSSSLFATSSTIGNIYVNNLYQNGSTYTGSRFTVNSSNGSMWTTGGNMGIGTTSPNYRLDVNGDIRVTGNFIKGSLTGSAASQNVATKAFNTVYQNTTGRLKIVTVVVMASVNNESFTIYSDANSSPTTVIGGSVVYSANKPITFFVLPNHYYKITKSSNGTINSWSEWSDTAATGSQFTILNNNLCYTVGNIGIGTTNPGYLLDISGGSLNVSGPLYSEGYSVDRQGGIYGASTYKWMGYATPLVSNTVGSTTEPIKRYSIVGSASQWDTTFWTSANNASLPYRYVVCLGGRVMITSGSVVPTSYFKWTFPVTTTTHNTLFLQGSINTRYVGINVWVINPTNNTPTVRLGTYYTHTDNSQQNSKYTYLIGPDNANAQEDSSWQWVGYDIPYSVVQNYATAGNLIFATTSYTDDDNNNPTGWCAGISLVPNPYGVTVMDVKATILATLGPSYGSGITAYYFTNEWYGSSKNEIFGYAQSNTINIPICSNAKDLFVNLICGLSQSHDDVYSCDRGRNLIVGNNSYKLNRFQTGRYCKNITNADKAFGTIVPAAVVTTNATLVNGRYVLPISIYNSSCNILHYRAIVTEIVNP